ncbi:MAG TPA: metallopeptidase TldD-related protein [Polyangia bacterium]|nr:metallopeptidase TldD-related protein [Polyangia bacterium]
MIRRLLVTVAVAASLGAVAQAGDVSGDPAPRVRSNDGAVASALKDELGRSMSELRLGDEARPYFLGYTVYDLDQATVNATLGALTAEHAYRGRILRTDLRVGDPSFDNTNFEGGAKVETIPLEDDYAALRRELWLRTDEAYKSALETLARKRAAAAGQAAAAEDEAAVGDFSKEAAAHLEVPFPAGAADPEALRETARKLSSVLADFPDIASSRVAATFAIVRRRFCSSEGSFVDDNQRTVRIDVVAETQAPDGMKLKSFVPFTALTPAGLPPLAEMEKSVRAMAKELSAMRTAPVVTTGAGAVLFEGLAAPQVVKQLLGDQIAGTPPPRTAQAGSDDGGEQGALATKLGQKVASSIFNAVDDPLLAQVPGKALYGTYKIDDEGVPAQKVSVVEHGVLKSLLMSRTPRKEIAHSNGHARAPKFAGPRARVGTLVVSGARPLARPALLDELGKISKSGGVTTYVVKLLDDDSLPGSDADDMAALLAFGLGSHGPPPVRPLVVYRLDHGKETLVRGLLLENLLPRSLKDITAVGADGVAYNFLEGGAGFSGVPTTIVSPPLLLSDVDVRRQSGRNRKPPLYPSPLARH